MATRVSDVRASQRLTISASCLVAGGQGRDRELERLLAQQNRGAVTKPILEINLRHPLVAAISGAKDAARDLSLLLLEQAQILDGELPEDPAAFAGRLNRLVLQGLKPVDAIATRTRMQNRPYLLERAVDLRTRATCIAMTMAEGSERFYGSIPVFRGFGQADGPGAVFAAAGRLEYRRRRYRGIDQGDCGGALQGRQHGRRGGDRIGHQCVGRSRVSVRVRRRRRELCGVAGRSRARPRSAGGDRHLGQGRPRPCDAGGAGAGRRGAGAGPRCAGGAVRAVAQLVLRDVFRRRPWLGRSCDEARRIRGAGGAVRHPAGSHRPVMPVRGNSLGRAGLSCRC